MKRPIQALAVDVALLYPDLLESAESWTLHEWESMSISDIAQLWSSSMQEQQLIVKSLIDAYHSEELVAEAEWEAVFEANELRQLLIADPMVVGIFFVVSRGDFQDYLDKQDIKITKNFKLYRWFHEPTFGALDDPSGSGKRGGSNGRYNVGLQEAMDRIHEILCSVNGKGITPGTFMAWMEKQGASSSLSTACKVELDPPIPDCDELYLDGEMLVWKDRNGEECAIKLTSLRRYFERVKNKYEK